MDISKILKNSHQTLARRRERLVKHSQALGGDFGIKYRDGKPDLTDMFTAQKSHGLGPKAQTLPEKIRTAVQVANESLAQFEFPIFPQLTYEKSASAADSDVIHINAKFRTLSGIVDRFSIPVSFRSGEPIQPGIIWHAGREKVLSQSTVNEMVQRNSSYALPQTRGQFVPPFSREQREIATDARNSAGYQARESGGSLFVRRNYGKTAQVDWPNADTEIVFGLIVEDDDMFDLAQNLIASAAERSKNSKPSATSVGRALAREIMREVRYEVEDVNEIRWDVIANELIEDDSWQSLMDDSEIPDDLERVAKTATVIIRPTQMVKLTNLDGTVNYIPSFITKFTALEEYVIGNHVMGENTKEVETKKRLKKEEQERLQREKAEAKKQRMELLKKDPLSVPSGDASDMKDAKWPDGTVLMHPSYPYKKRDRKGSYFDIYIYENGKEVKIADDLKEKAALALVSEKANAGSAVIKQTGNQWDGTWENITNQFVKTAQTDEEEYEEEFTDEDAEHEIELALATDPKRPWLERELGDEDYDEEALFDFMGYTIAFSDGTGSFEGGEWGGSSLEEIYEVELMDGWGVIYGDSPNGEFIYVAPERAAVEAYLLSAAEELSAEEEMSDPGLATEILNALDPMTGEVPYDPNQLDLDFSNPIDEGLENLDGKTGAKEGLYVVTYRDGSVEVFESEEDFKSDSLTQDPSSAAMRGSKQYLPTDLVWDMYGNKEGMVYWSPTAWESAGQKAASRPKVSRRVGGTGTKVPVGYKKVTELMDKAAEEGLDTFPRTWIHCLRNYILQIVGTASQDAWQTHLTNDGYCLSPLGNNRGRNKKGSTMISDNGFKRLAKVGKKAFRMELETPQFLVSVINVTQKPWGEEEEPEDPKYDSEMEDEKTSLEELKSLTRSEGYFNEGYDWWQTYPDENYRTGEQTYKTLHIKNLDGSELSREEFARLNGMIKDGFKELDDLDYLPEDDGDLLTGEVPYDPRQEKLPMKARKHV